MKQLIKRIWERIGFGKTQQPQEIAVVEPGPTEPEKKTRKPRQRKAK